VGEWKKDLKGAVCPGVDETWIHSLVFVGVVHSSIREESTRSVEVS